MGRARMIDPRHDFNRSNSIAEGPDGPERRDAIARMELVADSDGGFATSMYMLHLGSPTFVPDESEAARWALRGMTLGYRGAVESLRMLLVREDDLLPYGPEGWDSQPAVRSPEPLWGRGYVLDPLIVTHPVMDALLAVTGTEMDEGTTCLDGFANRHGGFENGMFAIVPSPRLGWGEAIDSRIDRRANFVFKPTGFEISWRHGHMFEDGLMNRPLTNGTVVRILLRCLDSAIGTVGRRIP